MNSRHSCFRVRSWVSDSLRFTRSESSS